MAAGSAIWLSAAFTPRFSISSSPAGVAVVNTQITIDGLTSAAPDSYVDLVPGSAAPGSISYVNDQWQGSVPASASRAFLSAVSVTVPQGKRCSGAVISPHHVTLAPGQIDVSVAAAVYSSKYKAGAPTGCASKLKPGGTGRGNGDCTGSASDAYPICKSSGCSKPKDNSGWAGYPGNGRGRNW